MISGGDVPPSECRACLGGARHEIDKSQSQFSHILTNFYQSLVSVYIQTRPESTQQKRQKSEPFSSLLPKVSFPRTKKTPAGPKRAGGGQNSAVQRWCFRSIDLRSGNGASHGHADHGVVAGADQAHHLNVSRHAGRAGELSVAVHTAHGVGQAVRSGAGSQKYFLPFSMAHFL